jgi:hypothetical protein
MSEEIDLRKYYNGKPRFTWAEDLVTFTFKQPRYLIKPIIPSATWGILYGHPEAGKTQLALSMAMGIIEGGHFLSRFSCKAGRVGLVEIDTEINLMQERLEFIERMMSFGEKRFGIAHYNSAINILQMLKRSEKDPEVLNWLEPMKNMDFVIVDSLNKVHDEDEWSNRTPMKVYNAFREILGSGPTIMFIHHARKDTANPTKPHAEDDHDARGSGALKGDSNFMIKLYKRGKGEERTIRIIKAKGAPESVKVPYHITLNPKTLLFEPSDPAFARAFSLVDVGFSKQEVVQKLVEEDLCKETKAREMFLQATEILGEQNA